MSKQLAYHEAGHYIVNALLRNINFEISLRTTFPPPNKIWINEDTGKGQVERAGFPIMNWNEETRIQVAGYLLNYPVFYIQNPTMATAVAFLSIAGYVSESTFIDKERTIKFGHKEGERPDYKNIKSVISYTILKRFESNKSPEYEEACHNKMRELIDALRTFFNNEAIIEAIHFVAKALLDQEKEEDGAQIITQKDIQALDKDVMEIITGSVEEFKSLIDEHSP